VVRSRRATNPTFNPVAKPGAFHETLKSLERGELPEGPRYGELAPLDRAFMYRDERIDYMDEQNLERMFIYPTIGLSCEHMFANDWDMLYDFFHAFNGWIDDDWGFNYQNRIYAPPVMPMADVHRSLDQLEWAIARGADRDDDARPVVRTLAGRLVLRSVLATDERRKVSVIFRAYGGTCRCMRELLRPRWARPPVTNQMHSLDVDEARSCRITVGDGLDDGDDLGRVVQRFPNLKVASIEVGAAWVSTACTSSIRGQQPRGAACDHVRRRAGRAAIGRFKQHCYVARSRRRTSRAATAVGADRVLFGSDWPHPEGVADPATS
jgi:hypothetical protein